MLVEVEGSELELELVEVEGSGAGFDNRAYYGLDSSELESC